MVDDIDRRISARLKELRQRRGVTQSKLAARIGVTFQQVQKYENGQSRIAASQLWRIADALDVPLQYFFYESST